MNDRTIEQIRQIQNQIKECRACPNVIGTPVHGPAIASEVLLIGQAPGPHESDRGKPFAYTAGKTLFKWFLLGTGISEEEFRQKVYISAVARCFPGKNEKGSGDREPNKIEIQNCRKHLSSEIQVLRPRLILAVGKVAISEVLGVSVYGKSSKLSDVVGKQLKGEFNGLKVDVICLPHPSGVSRWPNTEPGKSLLVEALKLVKNHPVWAENLEKVE